MAWWDAIAQSEQAETDMYLQSSQAAAPIVNNVINGVTSWWQNNQRRENDHDAQHKAFVDQWNKDHPGSDPNLMQAEAQWHKQDKDWALRIGGGPGGIVGSLREAGMGAAEAAGAGGFFSSARGWFSGVEHTPPSAAIHDDWREVFSDVLNGDHDAVPTIEPDPVESPQAVGAAPNTAAPPPQPPPAGTNAAAGGPRPAGGNAGPTAGAAASGGATGTGPRPAGGTNAGNARPTGATPPPGGTTGTGPRAATGGGAGTPPPPPGVARPIPGAAGPGPAGGLAVNPTLFRPNIPPINMGRLLVPLGLVGAGAIGAYAYFKTDNPVRPDPGLGSNPGPESTAEHKGLPAEAAKPAPEKPAAAVAKQPRHHAAAHHGTSGGGAADPDGLTKQELAEIKALEAQSPSAPQQAANGPPTSLVPQQANKPDYRGGIQTPKDQGFGLSPTLAPEQQNAYGVTNMPLNKMGGWEMTEKQKKVFDERTRIGPSLGRN